LLKSEQIVGGLETVLNRSEVGLERGVSSSECQQFGDVSNSEVQAGLKGEHVGNVSKCAM
jgi:hypothetical protein